MSNYGGSVQPHNVFVISDETVPAVRLVIAPGTGNVGIGTNLAVPITPLHVAGNNANELSVLTIENLSTRSVSTKNMSINFAGRDTVNTQKVVGKIVSFSDNAGDNTNWIGGGLAFYTRSDDMAPKERVRITSTGNVGIGTMNPQKRLDINGGLKTDEICLPNGSVLGQSKCFKSVCPDANGQWVLSEDKTCVVIPPPPTVTLTLSTDPDNVPARYIVMGSADNILYKLKLSANNTEDTRVTDIIFTDTITNNTAGIASLNNLRLLDNNGQLIAGPVNSTLTGSTPGKIRFSMDVNSSLVIPKNSSRTVIVKGDAATFYSGAVSNSGHTFGIASTRDITAYGKDSSAAATILGTPSGTSQTIYRTKPLLTLDVFGAQRGRMRPVVDQVARMSWSANAADDLTIQKVTIKVTGSAVNNASAFEVYLRDETNAPWGNSREATCTPSGTTGCMVTFNPNFIITRGTTKAVRLWVNSSKFGNLENDSFSATIDMASNILWNDGTTNNISWEAVRLPITLANINYE